MELFKELRKVDKKKEGALALPIFYDVLGEHGIKFKKRDQELLNLELFDKKTKGNSIVKFYKITLGYKSKDTDVGSEFDEITEEDKMTDQQLRALKLKVVNFFNIS